MSQAPMVSMVLFLPKPRALELAEVERAAKNAFQKQFDDSKRRVARASDRPGAKMFGVLTPVMTFGVICAEKPYFGADTGKAADAMRDFSAKRAVQTHQAWISVDWMRDQRPMPQEFALALVGTLLAEFVQPDALGLMRRPDGRIVGYQPGMLPWLRGGKQKEAFDLKPLDPLVTAKADDGELAAATAEAIRRLPEFIEAFAKRQPGHGFGVKKCFQVGDVKEHMWVEVASVEGRVLSGRISNDPQSIRSLKLGDPATVSFDEIEDWIFTQGRHMVGGFQIAVLQKYGK